MNQSPSTALQGIIPAEVYYGKVNFTKLKVFGSRAWAYKLPVSRDKLETRAVECRMVGCRKNGNRLWDPVTDKKIVSRDVNFEETNYIYSEPSKEENTQENVENQRDEEDTTSESKNVLNKKKTRNKTTK